MKKLIYPVAIIISSLIVLAGCSKDASIIATPPPPPPPPPCNPCDPSPKDSSIYNLNIYNWLSDPNSGVYTYDMGSIRVPAGVSSSPQIIVYVLDGGKATSINNPVTFKGGSLWTIINGLDVKIVYRNESGQTYIPFTNLTIKIELK
jgi:hypothetical protein